jgi:hypothetical protein
LRTSPRHSRSVQRQALDHLLNTTQHKPTDCWVYKLSNRRATLAAAVAAALPALGTPAAVAALLELDPIFAAIDNHRCVTRYFCSIDETHPEWDETGELEANILQQVLRTVPTTLAGVAALHDTLSSARKGMMKS